MIASEGADLGQLRVAGSTPDYYLDESSRPFPFKSEGKLIDEGVITNLEPIWGKLDWPDWKVPPPTPSVENEVYDIRRSMKDTIWPHAATWNLNYHKGNWGTLKESESPTPTMVGLGEGPEHAEAATLISVGLFAAAISTFTAIAAFRVIGKEQNTFWQIMLGVGGGFSIIGALQGLKIAGTGMGIFTAKASE
jgi:hypothetical protein